MTRILIILAGLVLLLGGCAEWRSKWPAPQTGSGGSSSFDRDAEVRQVESLLSDAPRLIALSADDAKRELAVATQALAANPGDTARLRLAWLLTLGIGGRNDARLISLVDEMPYSARPVDSPLRQIAAVMQRTAFERVRAQQDAQGRNEAKLRETEQKLREAQARADDLQQKLDALLNVERTLNQRSNGKRK